MAAVQGQLQEFDDFVDKRRALPANIVKNVTVLTTAANFNDRNSLEAKLLTLSYTQATLNCMSINDLIYAVRIGSEAAGV